MNFLQSIFGTIHQKTPRTGLSRKDTKKARKLYEDGVKLMLTDDGRERGKQYCLQAARWEMQLLCFRSGYRIFMQGYLVQKI